jgi:mediator of RNA polymerase II transcription subunit 5
LIDLLEPFLLPSLVVGLQWLASHLWQTTTGTKISLSLLQSLIGPPSPTEAREIHQTILAMTAETLSLQLRAIAGESPQKQVASAIEDALSPYMSLKRNISWVSEDLQPLTASSGGLLTSIRQIFHQLLDWSTSLEVNASPPKFNFKFISAAVHLHRSPKVLAIFLSEVKMLLGTDKFDAGLDMLTSIICAPVPSTSASTQCLSLRDALEIFHTDLAKTVKAGDTLLAELLVRLHHRVEASSAAIPQQDVSLDPQASISADLSNIDLQNINLDATAGNAEIDVSALGIQPTSEDIDQILEGAVGMENFGTNNMGSGTDDVFGLEGGDMQMMNFDDMDLEGMF